MIQWSKANFQKHAGPLQYGNGKSLCYQSIGLPNGCTQAGTEIDTGHGWQHDFRSNFFKYIQQLYIALEAGK